MLGTSRIVFVTENWPPRSNHFGEMKQNPNLGILTPGHHNVGVIMLVNSSSPTSSQPPPTEQESLLLMERGGVSPVLFGISLQKEQVGSQCMAECCTNLKKLNVKQKLIKCL